MKTKETIPNGATATSNANTEGFLKASTETILKFYESARQEILMRIRLRDQVFISYLAGIAAIFGVGLGSAGRQEIVLVAPFICLGTTFLISHHHEVMAVLATYCVKEIGPALSLHGIHTQQWDGSKTYAEHSSRFITMRSCGHALLIFIPAAGALAVTWKYGFYSAFPWNPLWWAGLGCTLLALALCRKTHHFRMNVRAKMHAEHSSASSVSLRPPADSITIQDPKETQSKDKKVSM